MVFELRESDDAPWLWLVFFGRGFLTYPRHLWTGSVIAVSPMVVLAVVRGLLWKTWSVSQWLGQKGDLTSGDELQHLHAAKHSI